LNLVAVAPAWLLILLGCAMLAAAIEDGIRLRISNLTSLVVLAGAILSAVLAGPTWGLWQNFVVFAAVLVVGTVAFSSGLLGGGDVKLFAAAGLWFDFASAIWFVAFVFLAGGVLAIVYIAVRAIRRAAVGNRQGSGVPYGIAIAVGAATMVLVNVQTAAHKPRPFPAIRIVPHQH
jgi:prepilin peptidase CpaA